MPTKRRTYRPRNGKPTKTPEQRAAEAAELRQALEDKVKALTTSEGWMAWLHFQGRFRRYSVNNQLLIWVQRPDTVQVAGYTVWPTMGRQVREGADPIYIYTPPLTKKTGEVEVDEATGEETETKKRVGPKRTRVFAYEDTDPIPGAKRVYTPELEPKPTLLEGEEEADIRWALQDWLEEQGWTVEEADLGPVNGTTNHQKKLVRIHADRSPNQQSKTMIHECAHVLLEHGVDMADYIAHQGFMEVEAESVAYVVAGLFGFNTGDYSVNYVLGWANGDPKVLKDSADSVLKAVNQLVKVLDVSGAPAKPEQLFDEDTKAENVAAGKEASAAYWAAKRAAQPDAAPTVPASETVTA